MTFHSRRKASGFTVKHVAGSGYVVTDLDGKWLGTPSPFRGQVQRQRDDLQREADKAAKRGPRPCMRCENMFDSEGIHHRMCSRCRSFGETDQSVRPALPARRVG